MVTNLHPTFSSILQNCRARRSLPVLKALWCILSVWMYCMKRIALAAVIIVCLALLSSSFVIEQDYPPASTGSLTQGYLSKLPPFLSWPATPNEPVYRTSTPTPPPSFMGHIPVTIYMGKPSDLSFIYEGGKLAYVQFYSKDDDRVVRIPYGNYMRLASMGKAPYYGTFTPSNQAAREAGYRQGAQEKAKGLSIDTTSVQGVVNSLRDYTQSMIRKVRDDIVPAVNGKIVNPLRDYTQGMINKVRHL